MMKINAAPAQGRCREPELPSCYFGFCESVELFGLFVVLVLVEPELSTPGLDVPAPTLPVPLEVLLVSLEDVPAPTPVVGEVLVDEPVVAELSVEVPVVALPLELAPVFGFVLGLAPVVALPVAFVSDEPVVDPLAVPPAPARVSSPVVPGVAVPAAPVPVPVAAPVSDGFVAVPALVPPPTEPALVPPPVCARAPAAARAPVTRIVPTNLPILITSSFASDHGHGARVCEPAETVGSKIAPSVPRPLVLHRPAYGRAELPRGAQRPVRIAEKLAGEDDHVRLLRAKDMLRLESLPIIPTAPVAIVASRRIRSANGVG